MTEGIIRVVEPERVRLEQAENHIRNLIAIINALVPMHADCGIPTLLAEIENWLDDSV